MDTFTLFPHSPTYFVTSLLHGNFACRGLSCPNFDRFLWEVTGEDEVLIERIWQMIGYTLTSDNGGKCFFLLQGVADSGKSVLTDLIASLLEEDMVTSLELTALGERFGAAVLVGKQLCIVPDMPSGVLDSKSVSMLKALTGGDVVTVDVKYQPRIKFRNRATFILASNHPLLSKDFDSALINRAVVIPFRFSVPRKRQNLRLRELFEMEKDSIIWKALQAYRRLRSQNYQFTGTYEINAVVASGGQWNGEAQSVSMTTFLWDFCCNNLVLEIDGFVSTTDLYNCFQKTTGGCYPGGLVAFSTQIWPILQQIFSTEVSKARTRKTDNGQQERGFKGIALRFNAIEEGECHDE